MENLFVTVEGRNYINTTPHDINCLNSLGELVVIPASGILINAKMVEKPLKEVNGINFVTTVFEKDETSLKLLEDIEQKCPGGIIIGSVIAAQAYPGRVCGLVAAKGYERVAPAEKRMRIDKFNLYE